MGLQPNHHLPFLHACPTDFGFTQPFPTITWANSLKYISTYYPTHFVSLVELWLMHCQQLLKLEQLPEIAVKITAFCLCVCENCYFKVQARRKLICIINFILYRMSVRMQVKYENFEQVFTWVYSQFTSSKMKWENYIFILKNWVNVLRKQ